MTDEQIIDNIADSQELCHSCQYATCEEYDDENDEWDCKHNVVECPNIFKCKHYKAIK